MELIKEISNVTQNTQSTAALQQLVEFSWKATRGLVDSTEAHVQQLVEKLADTGRITSEERAKLSGLLKQRLNDSRKVFLLSIDDSIRTAVEKIAELSKKEVTELETSVAALEKRLAQLVV